MSILATCLLSTTLLAASAVPWEEDAARSYYHFSLAQLLILDHKPDEALEEMRTALGFDPESSQLHVEYAEMLFNLRRAADALTQARKAIELDPENGDAHASLGRMLLGLNQQDEALGAFEKAVEFDPDNYTSYFYAGRIHMNKKRFDEAAEAFAQVLRLRPGTVQVAFLRASALEQANRLDEAIQTLEDGLRTAGGDFQLLEFVGRLYERVGRVEDAIRTYRSIRSGGLADPSEIDEVDRRLASWLQSSGKLEEASQLLMELVERNPTDVHLNAMLGFILADLGLYDQAVERLGDVLGKLKEDWTPGRLQVAYNLGRALEGMGRREEAERRYRALIDLESPEAKPFRRASRISLALLLQRQGDYEHSLQILEDLYRQEPDDNGHAIRLALAYSAAKKDQEALETAEEMGRKWPEDEDAIAIRAQLLAKHDRMDEAVELIRELQGKIDDERYYLSFSQLYAAQSRWEEAEKAVRDGLAKLPESEDLIFQLASTLERSGRIEAAATEFRRLLKRDPENHSVLNYLGYMLADNDLQLQEALEMIQKAVKAEPFNGAYLDSLGWAHFRLGNWEEAAEYLQKAIRITSDDPTIFEHLGDLYVKLDQLERARESYEASLRMATDDEERERARNKLRRLDHPETPQSRH